MSVLAVAWVLCLNHIRRGAVLIDLAVALLIALTFLDPAQGPYDWSYIVAFYGLTASVLPSITAVMLAVSAASVKSEDFLLRAGRSAFYLGSVLASFVMGLFWMAAMGGLVPLLGLREIPQGGLGMLAAAAALNVLLVAVVFSLFSPLCGGPKEPAVGVSLVLLGINSLWFQEHANLWLRRAEALLPPLYANTHAAMEALLPDLIRNTAYLLALVAVGLLRFHRREFFRR